MHCDECGAEFTPTPENPGTTFVAGYPEEARVETLHLCDAHVAWFHALEMPEQHAVIEHVRARQAAQNGDNA